MADTFTSTLLPETGNSQRGRNVYIVEKEIDLTAVAIDPSNGDIAQMITVPANMYIVHAGVQVVESATMNTGTDATVILGTDLDPNEFVAAFDIDGATDGAYAPAITPLDVVVQTAANTLDLTFAGTGASFTAGKLRVFAMLMDVSSQGDTSANEVDRDTLA